MQKFALSGAGGALLRRRESGETELIV